VRAGRVGRRFWVREPDPFLVKRLFEPDVVALKELAHRLGMRARDTIEQGPLPLNLYAVSSGTFWRGRNAMPLSQAHGGRVTLACLLTDEPAPAPALPADRCGSCRRCVATCPTGALLGDGRVDLNRCVSYWTTRHQDVLPLEWWPAIGSWLFGCDLCQDVCPWTVRAERAARTWPGFRAEAELAHPDLADFLTLAGAAFARKYASTAFERAGRTRMARNALVVLANAGDPAHRDLLRLAAGDAAPLVRATAGQALAVTGDRPAAERLLADPDATVRSAVRTALESV
jgi:epoxyqueuosine reductase QueG